MNPFLGRVAQDPMFFFWAAVAGCSFISTVILVLIMHWIMRYMSRKAFDKMADEYSGGIIKAQKIELAAKDRVIESQGTEIRELRTTLRRVQMAWSIRGEEG